MKWVWVVAILSLLLRLRPSDSKSLQQLPNTDAFYVSEFFRKMMMMDRPGNVCSWQGVMCSSVSSVSVMGLSASGMKLSGAIPDTTLGKLSKLEILDLSNNNITGSLPSDFWSLIYLTTLNLSYNHLSGPFPSNLANFPLLQFLDLSSNYFSAHIPPSLLDCRSLISLDISSNLLSDTLPHDFASAFPNLIYLNLAHNSLSGSPSLLFRLPSLIHLNVSSNSFHGPLFSADSETLQLLDLSRNQFTSQLPAFNWSSLIYLDLSENHLSRAGQLFWSILSPAPNLRHLNLANNQLSDQPFPPIHLLYPRLHYLNLSQAGLRGPIPVSVSQLTNLITLDLSGNRLNGRIPPIHIQTLNVIDVSCNNLSGNIPASILQKLPSMLRFNFSHNNLTICASTFSADLLKTAFIGTTNWCPIAADASLFNRKPPQHDNKGLKLAVALTLSMIFLFVGLLFLAFGCRCSSRNRTWAVKHNSYFYNGEHNNISGPFSFQADSTIWVADVKQATTVPVVIFDQPLLNFTFADLLSATSHFDRGTLLAEGRFGPVYRGLLAGGLHVAVKVLVHGSTTTDQDAALELEYLGRIKHPNLVPLTGYCLAGEQRIAIYEYMENGNLQNLLHDLPLGVQRIDDWSTDTWEEGGSNGIQNIGVEGLLTNWRFRHKIALGTARALAFLHHGCSPPIVHRDVKASNVYLDSELQPRLSDFGLAKLSKNDGEDGCTCGSPAYLPPEFLEQDHGIPTPKYDVYGFGVVLLELITGKRPMGDHYLDEKEASLVNWVRKLVRNNEGLRAIDPKILGTGKYTHMVEALKIGYLCTAELPSKRPNMQQIVGLLKDVEPCIQP